MLYLFTEPGQNMYAKIFVYAYNKHSYALYMHCNTNMMWGPSQERNNDLTTAKVLMIFYKSISILEFWSNNYN